MLAFHPDGKRSRKVVHFYVQLLIFSFPFALSVWSAVMDRVDWKKEKKKKKYRNGTTSRRKRPTNAAINRTYMKRSCASHFWRVLSIIGDQPAIIACHEPKAKAPMKLGFIASNASSNESWLLNESSLERIRIKTSGVAKASDTTNGMFGIENELELKRANLCGISVRPIANLEFEIRWDRSSRSEGSSNGRIESTRVSGRMEIRSDREWRKTGRN